MVQSYDGSDNDNDDDSGIELFYFIIIYVSFCKNLY